MYQFIEFSSYNIESYRCAHLTKNIKKKTTLSFVITISTCFSQLVYCQQQFIISFLFSDLLLLLLFFFSYGAASWPD